VVGWMLAVAVAAEPPLVEVAVVDHAPIAENSGIVQSRRWPGTYWVHNDSGSAASVFALDAAGEVVVPPFLRDRFTVGPEASRRDPPLWPGLELAGASNIDWEDIAVDDEHLYIGEVGNNGNARRDLGVYVLREPNPAAVDRARPLAFWPVAYPEQQAFPPDDVWRYDCEAMFVFGGRLYFLSKHRPAGQMGTPRADVDLYRLDTTHTDRVNVLAHVDHLDDIGGWVTAADLSPDGRRLAVLVYAPDTAVVLFEVPAVGDALLSGPSRRIPLDLQQVKQAEGITWVDATTVRISNEQRQLFDLSVGD